MQKVRDQRVADRSLTTFGVMKISSSVWVTLDGDLRDLVLDAGQSCKIDSERRALIQALDPARVRLIPPSGAL